MPSIYPDYDGIVYKYQTDTWVNIRSATSGYLSTTLTYIDNKHTSGRGSDTYGIFRYFLEFDTSGITSTPSAATLKIKGKSGTSNLDVILLKSSHTGSVATGDFDEITNASTPLGNSDGSGAGTFASTSVVEYSAQIESWSTSGYNDIALNSDALSDMTSGSTFNCVLIGHDYDYLDQAPSNADYRINFYQDSTAGTSSDPYIDYTVATTAADNAIFFGTNF